MSQIPFVKPSLTLSEQVALLKSRGMRIANPLQAEETLLRLNYYRFSGYALHFEIFKNRQRTHQFKPGTTFERVIELYEFDTRLRALLFRYIEPVEIAFRAALCYELTNLTKDPHWYLDKSRYDSFFDFCRLEEECNREFNRSDELFVASYKEKYNSPLLPPVWMMSEILSIGRWSLVYKNLADDAGKKAVARHFSTKPHFLASWIHSLSVLRNFCAHHCRIWNRTFTIRPALSPQLKPLVLRNDKVAALVVVLTHLLGPLNKNADFDHHWDSLLREFPQVPLNKMGFLPQSPGSADT